MRFHDVESRAREEAEAKVIAEAKAAEKKRKMDAFYEKLYISESSDDEDIIESLAPAIAINASEEAEEEANNVSKKHRKMVESPYSDDEVLEIDWSDVVTRMDPEDDIEPPAERLIIGLHRFRLAKDKRTGLSLNPNPRGERLYIDEVALGVDDMYWVISKYGGIVKKANVKMSSNGKKGTKKVFPRISWGERRAWLYLNQIM